MGLSSTAVNGIGGTVDGQIPHDPSMPYYPCSYVFLHVLGFGPEGFG